MAILKFIRQAATAPSKRRRRHTVTDIVAAVYCEQKLVFDKTRGSATTEEVRKKAARGTAEHRRFELEGYTRQPGRLVAKAARDARCFIATAVYGGDAPETELLRTWRDDVLLPSMAGRCLVRAYYLVSPTLLRMIGGNTVLTAAIKGALDLFLKAIRRPS